MACDRGKHEDVQVPLPLKQKGGGGGHFGGIAQVSETENSDWHSCVPYGKYCRRQQLDEFGLLLGLMKSSLVRRSWNYSRKQDLATAYKLVISGNSSGITRIL